MYGSPYGYHYGHGYGHGNAGYGYGWPQIGVGWRLDGYGRWWHPQQGYAVPWPNYFQQPEPRAILSTAASSGCCGTGEAPRTQLTRFCCVSGFGRYPTIYPAHPLAPGRECLADAGDGPLAGYACP